jgi:hypothetical protein
MHDTCRVRAKRQWGGWNNNNNSGGWNNNNGGGWNNNNGGRPGETDTVTRTDRFAPDGRLISETVTETKTENFGGGGGGWSGQGRGWGKRK